MPIDHDLMYPPARYEARLHKMKRLIPKPNSYFLDIKCLRCFNLTTVFSHTSSVVFCSSCKGIVARPTGGKTRITDGCMARPKPHL